MLKSRKFVLAVLALGITSVLVYLKTLGSSEYCALVGTIVLTYLSANVAQKATAKKE